MPSTNRPLWLLARRPLLLALVLGFGISLIVSGRFTVRLIADGALSFAFVPLAELAGLALVYYLGRQVLPFAQAVDRFFAGNTAWLWWLLALMTVTVVLPVVQHERLLAPLLLSLLIPIVLSVRHDLLYFRDVLGDTRARAWICHPAIYTIEEAQGVFEGFAQRTSAAAIGSSDFHGFGRLGLCRTFVFARDTSAEAILEAIRARRTVVYGRNGQGIRRSRTDTTRRRRWTSADGGAS